MDVRCQNCGRSFQIDQTLAESTRYARCVCGERLTLGKDEARNGNQRLGKYVLQRRVAVGGMGEIYQAKIAGVEGFEREVAIKKMLPHLTQDRNFIDMMIKEAKLTVLLNHPNIVQVYDLAREGNDYYIAMEYVAGTNLGHLLEKCHLSQEFLPKEVATFIIMQVLRGLAYAHELRDQSGEPMHILHRDITPQNLLVTPSGWVKITDFGIAKARNEISTTSPGMIKGKLGYIAPEQLTGRAPDQRADIFCAAICLWESLATRRLFKGHDEIDTFRMIADARVPRLSDFRSDIPDDLEKAIRRGLAKDPEHRYHTADEFYDAINQAIFPQTADDYAQVAKRYFADHPEFFDSKAMNEPLAQSSTSEYTAPNDHELKPITELVTRENMAPTQRRRWPWLALGAALAVAASAVAAYVALQPSFFTSLTKRSSRPSADPSTDPRLLPLTDDEITIGVRGEAARLNDCYCQEPSLPTRAPRVSASLVIASTGGVAGVTLDPPESTLGSAGPCLHKVLQGLRFRLNSRPSTEQRVELPPPSDRSCASPPTPRPPTGAAPPRTPTPNRTKPLAAAEIQAAVQRSSGAILKCGDKADARLAGADVRAKLHISQSGAVTRVDISPPLEDKGVAVCLERSLKAIRFREQPSDDYQVTIPLKFQRVL